MMKNRLLVYAACIMSILLVSCKKDADLMPLNLSLADNNIPNAYTTLVMDSATMTTIVYEYTLNKDFTGNYRVVKSGDKVVNSDEVTNFTWKRGEYTEDLLYVAIDVTYEGGSKTTLKWGSAAVQDLERSYDRGAKASSYIEKVIPTFPGTDWKNLTTDYWIDKKADSLIYLSWKNRNDSLTQVEIDSINTILEANIDTLTWYNKTFIPWYNDKFKPQSKKKAVATKVQQGKWNADHTKCNCIYATSISKRLDWEDPDTIGVKMSIEASISLLRDGATCANTGAYSYRKKTFSYDYAKCVRDGLPMTEKATYYDSLYTCDINSWTIKSLVSNKKFDVLARGMESMNVDNNGSTKNVGPQQTSRNFSFSGVGSKNKGKEVLTLQGLLFIKQ